MFAYSPRVKRLSRPARRAQRCLVLGAAVLAAFAWGAGSLSAAESADPSLPAASQSGVGQAAGSSDRAPVTVMRRGEVNGVIVGVDHGKAHDGHLTLWVDPFEADQKALHLVQIVPATAVNGAADNKSKEALQIGAYVEAYGRRDADGLMAYRVQVIRKTALGRIAEIDSEAPALRLEGSDYEGWVDVGFATIHLADEAIELRHLYRGDFVVVTGAPLEDLFVASDVRLTDRFGNDLYYDDLAAPGPATVVVAPYYDPWYACPDPWYTDPWWGSYRPSWYGGYRPIWHSGDFDHHGRPGDHDNHGQPPPPPVGPGPVIKPPPPGDHPGGGYVSDKDTKPGVVGGPPLSGGGPGGSSSTTNQGQTTGPPGGQGSGGSGHSPSPPSTHGRGPTGPNPGGHGGATGHAPIRRSIITPPPDSLPVLPAGGALAGTTPPSAELPATRTVNSGQTTTVERARSSLRGFGTPAGQLSTGVLSTTTIPAPPAQPVTQAPSVTRTNTGHGAPRAAETKKTEPAQDNKTGASKTDSKGSK